MDKAKKIKPFRKDYHPMVVYVDALEDLYYTIRERCQSVELSSSDYKFDTLEAAKEHFGSAPQFDISITASKPYVSLNLSRLNSSVMVAEGAGSGDLFYELDATLSKCQRFAKILYAQWVWGAVLVVNGLASVVLLNVFPGFAYAYLAIALVCFAVVVWNGFIIGRRHSVVIFVRRSEAKTFLDTNRNAIIMSVITSIISGAIGYGFAKLKDAPAAPAVQVEQKQSAQ